MVSRPPFIESRNYYVLLLIFSFTNFLLCRYALKIGSTKKMAAYVDYRSMGQISELWNNLHFGMVGIPIMKLVFVSKQGGFVGPKDDLFLVEHGLT